MSYRETVLTKGIICKTEAKTSVTAEICHNTQVRKSDPMLRNDTFYKLVGKGGEKQQSGSF